MRQGHKPLRQISTTPMMGWCFQINPSSALVDLPYGLVPKDKHVLSVLIENFKPAELFSDVTRLKRAEVPAHEMLWAGFPCQPFSSQGLNQGCADHRGRGDIALHLIRILQYCMPPIAVFENVSGIVSKTHRETFDAIVGILKELTKDGLTYT
eukprot:14234801-Alexandrium_andersonii.AAC.1